LIEEQPFNPMVKLLSVNNPSNLYVHSEIKKEINSNLSLNFNKTQPKSNVILEGFSKKYLDKVQVQNQGTPLKNSYKGDQDA
jgi:hypothetical protein